jgi:3-isopropylmalate/(R)-2-methylmalate dehydratase large subunit
MAVTAFDKIWDAHVVKKLDDGRDILFVDRHILQEMTCAPAFESLRRAGRSIRAPELTFATQDHIVSTASGRSEASYPQGQELLAAIRRNARANGIRLFGLGNPQQGIVHIIGPELGLVLPGCVLACGDSHTSTAGGIGGLGIGIGTSEVEHVLATQCLVLKRPANMRIEFEGKVARGVSAKDLILYALGQLGIAAGLGRAIEYGGSAIRGLSVEERLTICNMSIELGARLGLVAPDETTVNYVAGRQFAPAEADLAAAVEYWQTLRSDADARFDRDHMLDCGKIAPQVTWGTTQQEVIGVDEPIPDPTTVKDPKRREALKKAIHYMGIEPGRPIEGTKVDTVFIGSCTNSRLSDLQTAAEVIRGHKVAAGVRALVVPGSNSVKLAAEAVGLHQVFVEAGFEWRQPGCSMCVSVNDDIVPPNGRCIATSNRNFENRQGPGARTHLASPATAAASAIRGAIADVRKFGNIH